MKKLPIAFVLAASVSVAPLALAKPVKDQLANVVAGECSEVAVVSGGTMLNANWSWDAGTIQTKFGGDAEYTVSYSQDGGANWDELEVEFELTQYEPDTLPEDYWGMLAYTCDAEQTAVEGNCNGTVQDIEEPILMAVEDFFGGAIPEGTMIEAVLNGVNVKAMNPGKGKGNQKYPLVNVCGDDSIEIM